MDGTSFPTDPYPSKLRFEPIDTQVFSGSVQSVGPTVGDFLDRQNRWIQGFSLVKHPQTSHETNNQTNNQRAPWLFLEFVGDEMLPKYYGDCNKPLKRSLFDNQYIRFWGSKEYCPDIMGIIRNHYVQARSFSSWVAQTSKDWDYTTQLYEDDNKPL